ncbi:uncharacterized protein BXZ73DRAFT_81884 [Epithele typhae]|uniref:uncharacterized protein n=1 Tax=Epithele typhae TaxID=378194 RepID=UPI00200812CC|nr:uncharacterized protein BXZ73DRAFT_81884 [Epithele typhae]KAH9913555.1 hypothetical protein BXZ73DRAFT_81884 [Epithele typhae]
MSDSSSAYEKSPFDDPSTDIVLRSSDDVEFHVHRLILSLASVVFTDILSLPQDPQSKHVDGKPTVDLLEDGNTLRHLLLYCYPTPKPRLEHPNEIIPVLKAAFKYEMHGPREELITALRHAAHVDPVRVWSFAVSQNGLDDVVRRAARHIKSHMSGAPALAMLEKNLRAAGLEEVLSEVSTGAYFRLREYIGGPDGTTPLRLEPALSESDAAADAPLSALELAKTCATFIPAHPPPDATLRCSDGVELKVHLLELVRCKLGSCPEDGDPAVYRVDARGHVVVCVLQVCYAKGDLDFMSTFDHVAGILSTFRSLHVCADLESRVKRYWDTKVARSVQRGDGAPLEAYLAAVQYGLKQEEIKAAVRCTLERTLVEVPYMEEASALAYHKLLTYSSPGWRGYEGSGSPIHATAISKRQAGWKWS